MTSDTEQMSNRLDALEKKLVAFKSDHDASHSDAVMALEARLRLLRGKISDDLARGDRISALRDELDRDLTGVSEELTALVTGVGRQE